METLSNVIIRRTYISTLIRFSLVWSLHNGSSSGVGNVQMLSQFTSRLENEVRFCVRKTVVAVAHIALSDYRHITHAFKDRQGREGETLRFCT